LTAVQKTKGCFQQKCQSSDKFKCASASECAATCAKVDGCKFWSFGEEANEKKCWLRMSDAGKEALANTVSGDVSCVPPTWPQCINADTIYRGKGQYSLMTDVSVHGKTAGCFQNNCKSTDKFDAATESECATTCYQVPECTHWSFGEESGVKKLAADFGCGEGSFADCEVCLPVLRARRSLCGQRFERGGLPRGVVDDVH
jgi:hypothetical protein